MNASASATIAAIEELPDHPNLGRLADFVGFRLRRIQNQLSRDFAAVTAEHNLRAGLFTALAIISANPGLSQAMLAREVGFDKSLAVIAIDDLESRGWAERRRSPLDRRRYALFTTPAGEAFLEEMFGKLASVEKDVLASLSADDLHKLSGMLDRIYETCFRERGDLADGSGGK